MSESLRARVYDSLIDAAILAWAYYVGRASSLPRGDAIRDAWEMFAALCVLNALLVIIKHTLRRAVERREQRRALLSLIER